MISTENNSHHFHCLNVRFLKAKEKITTHTEKTTQQERRSQKINITLLLDMRTCAVCKITGKPTALLDRAPVKAQEVRT